MSAVFADRAVKVNIMYPRHSRPRWLSWMRRPTGDLEVAGSTPAEVGNILSWTLNHEIFSTVILSLPLIQEGYLSVSGESMCTILVNRLEDWACPVNVWLGKLTALDMTPLGWLGPKTSTQTRPSELYPPPSLTQPGYGIFFPLPLTQYYSKTSVTRTSMTRLLWLIRTRFWPLGILSTARENKYLGIFLWKFLFIMIMYVVYTH